MNNVLDEIRKLDPANSSFWGRVGGLFDLMEIAEDEIAKAQARHPDAKERLWHTFRLLSPGHLTGYPTRFYRAHCHEILERVYNGVDTRPGTKAEVLTGLSEWSLEHKPNTATAALISELFADLCPEQPSWGADIIQAAKVTEPADAIPNLYADLQRKTAREERTIS